MSYHHIFDRLGNQVKPPKRDWRHTIIQRLSLVSIVVFLCILVWGRP